MGEVDAVPEPVPVEEPTPRPKPEIPRYRIRVFSSSSNAPRARRPSDIFLLVASLIGALVCVVPAPDPTALDAAITGLVQELPGLAGGLWEVSYDLLILWPLVLLIATLVTHGRKRVFRDMLLGLLVSLVYAAGFATEIGADLWSGLSESPPSGEANDYLAVRLAAACALIATASPHLSHPLKRVGRWIIGLGALAGIALGASVGVGTLAGLLIGVAAAATAHLIVGSPGGQLSLEEVARGLTELGVAAGNLRAAPQDPRGAAIARATSHDGRPLVVKIFGRDARQGQLISSTWASLRRRGEIVRISTGWQQAQHEAFVSLFAERGGVPVMPVVAAGTAPEGDAFLVLDADAQPLASLAPEQIDDRAIEELWLAFERLGRLGVAMGRVDGHGLFVREDGSAALGEFADATVAAERSMVLADKAQLLVVTALAVGRGRAVPIAARTVGNEALEEALPYLQHAALDPEVWHAVKARDWSLEELRVMAEQETGSAPKELEELRRVTWGSILKLALIGFVACALFSAISNVGIDTIIAEIQSASKGWLVAALLLTPLAQVPQAVSTLGATIQRLRYWPALMLQYGIQFIALAVPSSAARVALEIRFYERVGVPAAGAVSIGMIDSFSGFCIQLLLIMIITISGLATLNIAADATSSSDSSSGIDWETLLIAFGLLAIAFLAALLVPRFRTMMKRFLDGLRDQAADGRDALKVLRHPDKLLFLLGGNLIAQVMLAIILGLCLKAFGYSATLAELILVNTFVSLFAGFMPVPGGVGVTEAAYAAGLIAIGIPEAAATSTALMVRLITFYIPPTWGSLAMRWMREHRYL